MASGLALLLAAAVPTVLVSLYFDWLDRRRPEPRSALRRVYLAGIVSVAPVLLVELMLQSWAIQEPVWGAVLWRAFVVAAIPEETAKVACIMLFVWRTAAFDERMDGITYGVRAGLGFALVENLGYFLSSPPEDLLQVLLVRSALLVPGHAAWGAIAGYWAARRRFDGDGIGAAGGWLAAVLLHGGYDACIFSMEPLTSYFGRTWGAGAALLGALLTLLFSLGWMRHLARRALHADHLEDARIVPHAR